MEQTLWGNLGVLVRANSKECIEYILEALWRTRKSGLGSTDRCVIQEILQLENESDLDPVLSLSFVSMDDLFIVVHIIIIIIKHYLQVLVCLRMLMRRCVYENTSKEDIPKLFPTEVLPELQKLLTLLLHKFQGQWQQDVMKDQVCYILLHILFVNSVSSINWVL